MENFPILWLTGNTGAGKTTLAQGVEKHFNESSTEVPAARRIVVLDGDEMRRSISLNETMSPEDRRTHNLRVARLAKELQAHGFFVVVAVIAPFQKVRDEVNEICNPVWVYIKRSLPEKKETPYEVPSSPHCIIDNDKYSISEACENLLQYLYAKYPQLVQKYALLRR